MADAVPLTWGEAVREANRNNPDLGAEKASVGKAEASLDAARAPFLPTITGRMSVTRANTPTSLNILGQTTGGGASNQYENSLTASQNIWNGWRDRATYDQQRAQRDSARWQLEGVRAQISAELKNAFSRLLYSQDSVQLSRQITERRAMNTRSVRLRFEAGRENKGSYLRTAADESSARFEEAQAQRTLRVAQRELARVLGRSSFDQLTATGTFIATDPGTPPDFTALARQTPAVQRAQLDLKSAESGIMLAQSGFSPTLAASATGSRSGRDWPPATERWSMGASLSIPFFSGGSTWYDRQYAVQEKKRAAFALTSTDQQVARDLEEAFANWQDAVGRVAVQQQYLDAALVRADIARGQYANGLMTFQDWDLIESELVNRQRSRLDSLRDAQVAETAWLNAQGASDPVWKEVQP